MYQLKNKEQPAIPGGVPELVREIKIEDMDIPIQNKR
jgi:branched-chain amino acid transport system substrate-binding protein